MKYKNFNLKKLLDQFISKTPNERWSMYLIDMSVGNNHTYIFSLVDNFSVFLWTRKLLNRTAQTIINNLNNIVETNYPNGSN